MTATAQRQAEGEAARIAALAPGVPLVESPLYSQFADAFFPEAEVRRVADRLHCDGFAILDFPEPDFDRVAATIKDALSPRFDWQGWRGRGCAAGIGMRVQDAWTSEPAVKRLACNAGIMDLLARLYGRRMWPFQTLSFPVGTQQHYHSDSVHFSTLPERFMCGVWVALEDVSRDAGPLVYYPGSHKWPVVYNEQIDYRIAGQAEMPNQTLYEPYWRAVVAAEGIEPQYFLPKKGQALIWSANLLHGGAPQTDPAVTRWSQVTHYFGDDCLYLTPMLSDIPTGNVHFRQMTDISTDLPVENRYCGAPLASLTPGFAAQRNTRLPPSAPSPIAPNHATLRDRARHALAQVGLLGAVRSMRRRFSRSPQQTKQVLH